MDGIVPLRRNRDFRRLWVSQVLSDTGSQATAIAYPLLVLALTGSAVSAGLVGTVASVVGVVLRLPGGVLADRVDRRRLMLACEAARLFAMGCVGIAVLTDRVSMAMIVVVAAVDAAGSVLFGSAERAGLRHLVPPGQLAAAAAGNEARIHTADMVGPSVGGLMFGLGRAVPFLADAVSYLVSLVAVALIRRPLQEARGTDEPSGGFLTSLAEGCRFVAGEPFLRAMATITPLLNMAFAGVLFVLVVVMQQAGVPSVAIGLAQAAIAASGLLGAVVTPRLLRLVPARLLITAMFWLMAVAVAICALLPLGYWTVVPLPIMMLLAPAVNAILFAHQTLVTPDRLHGRVLSVRSFLAGLASPIAPVLGGVLVEKAGGGAAFAVFAGCLAMAAVVATASRGIRRLGSRSSAGTRLSITGRYDHVREQGRIENRSQ